MQTTFKPSRQTKAAAINRNGGPSSTAVVKAEKKTAAKKKNGRPISRGTAEGNFPGNAGNKITAAKTTRKPHKFVHIAPKATAQEILDDLGIKPGTVKKVRQIMRDLGLNVDTTED